MLCCAELRYPTLCREREIKARLEALQRRAAASGEEDGSGEWGAGDEDDQREAWLLQIDLAAMKASKGPVCWQPGSPLASAASVLLRQAPNRQSGLQLRVAVINALE